MQRTLSPGIFGPLFSSVLSISPLRDVRYECVSYVGLLRLARGSGEVLSVFVLFVLCYDFLAFISL
jgi:hypothetical protein